MPRSVSGKTDQVQRVGRAYRKLGGDAALHVFDRGEDMARYCQLIVIRTE